MRLLGDLGVKLSTDAVMHTPVEVTERVMEESPLVMPIVSSLSVADRR
jgi:hypothetical protein